MFNDKEARFWEVGLLLAVPLSMACIVLIAGLLDLI